MSAYKINVENSPVNVGQTRRGSLLESPDAYKDMAVILENIKETVDVIEMVKPVYNFKAGGE